MADIQDDGKGSKYGGVSVPEGLTSATLHVQQRDAEMADSSAQALPELERKLKEKGVLFSKDRAYAIWVDHKCVQLRYQESGFPAEGYRNVHSRYIFERLTLLSLFELMERYNPTDDMAFPTKKDFE